MYFHIKNFEVQSKWMNMDLINLISVLARIFFWHHIPGKPIWSFHSLTRMVPYMGLWSEDVLEFQLQFPPTACMYSCLTGARVVLWEKNIIWIPKRILGPSLEYYIVDMDGRY